MFGSIEVFIERRVPRLDFLQSLTHVITPNLIILYFPCRISKTSPLSTYCFARKKLSLRKFSAWGYPIWVWMGGVLVVSTTIKAPYKRFSLVKLPVVWVISKIEKWSGKIFVAQKGNEHLCGLDQNATWLVRIFVYICLHFNIFCLLLLHFSFLFVILFIF